MKLPVVLYLSGPIIALLLSFFRTKTESKNSNGHYFVIGFGVSFSVAPFAYFVPYIKVFSPDGNFYLFAFVLNYIFINVIILQIKNLAKSNIVFHKTNLIGFAVAYFLSLNFYKELIDPSRKIYLLNYFIKSGWDNVAHFAIFNQIYSTGTNTKIASSDNFEIIGSSYPQHLHIVLGWGARTFEPYFNSTQSLYLYAVASFVLFALVSICIFFGISSISGDKFSRFIPAASLTVGVLFYSSLSASYLAGWQTFLFSQLLAFLTVLVIYRSQTSDFENSSRKIYVGAFLCILTNVWFLVGFVVVVLYAISSLFPRVTSRSLTIILLVSFPALITPFYFLYPNIGLSSLISGNSPGYSWRLFLLFLGMATLLGISSWVRGSSNYATFTLSTVLSTGLCAFGLLILVQIDSSSTTYYLNKLIQGCFVIILACITIIIVEELTLANVEFIKKRKARYFKYFSAIASLTLLQSLVWIGPDFKNSTDYLPMNDNNTNVRLLLGSSQEAIRILNVSNYMKVQQCATIYMSTFPTDPNNRLADLWARALAAKWTYQSENYSLLLNDVSQEKVSSIFGVIKNFLVVNPKGKVILSSDFYVRYSNQFQSFNRDNFYLIDDFGRDSNIG